MPPTPTLLLLTSGARPRYLEDVVRALALPAGGLVQFRYSSYLLSDKVKLLFQSNKLKGYSCYLAYLDNKTPGKADIVPIREAAVVDVQERGSSFIFVLSARRYIDVQSSNVVSFIQSNAQDALPSWKKDWQQHPDESPYEGYWVNEVNAPLADNLLIPHDPVNKSHLSAFENSVRALCRHADDFGDPSRRLFFNVIGLKGSGAAYVPLKDGRWKVSPGREYAIDIYHFYREENPRAQRPVYWIVSRVSGSSAIILGGDLLKADSEYDAKSITIQTSGTVRQTVNSIVLSRTGDPKDPNAGTADVTFIIEVDPDTTRNVLQALIIGTGVAATAMVADFSHLNWWKVAVIVGGALVAGFASVFRFAKDV